jgi:hypothetical protein
MMPKIDFSTVRDDSKYPALPKGKYLCKICEVKEDITQKGDEMWNVRFEVTDDENDGRSIYDRLVFNEIGLRRVKCLSEALGIDVTGEVDLTMDALLGRSCVVEVDVEEYVDRRGNDRDRNTVEFYGFSRKEEESSDDGSPY